MLFFDRPKSVSSHPCSFGRSHSFAQMFDSLPYFDVIIGERQKRMLDELTEILGLQHSQCAALLMAYNWRQTDLLNEVHHFTRHHNLMSAIRLMLCLSTMNSGSPILINVWNVQVYL
jgi:hypothetical protein